MSANRVVQRPGASLSLSSTTPVVLAPITKRIAVVLFNFSNNTTQPYTPTGANRFDVTQTGDYQIAPLYASSGSQALRVQRNSSSYLTLEYRQSGPFDVFSAGDPEVNGVTVRITGSDANRTQSLLVDMTPGTSSFTDAALLVGQTFVDPLTSVSMTTLATSSTAADVRISFAPDEAAPSQPGNFKATALDPYRIGLSWTTSTDNIGGRGLSRYEKRNARGYGDWDELHPCGALAIHRVQLPGGSVRRRGQREHRGIGEHHDVDA